MQFPQTQWTQINLASISATYEAKKALQTLLSTYWIPMYSFARSKGYDQENSTDLIQQFITDKFLAEGFLAKADRNKGKFRTFLLKALQNFFNDAYDAKHTIKRDAGEVVVYDTVEDYYLLSDLHSNSPEKCFNIQWIRGIINRALLETQRVFSGNRSHYWIIFQKLYINPILGIEPAPPVESLAEEFNISYEQVTNFKTTVKRRFTNILRIFLSKESGEEDLSDSQIIDLL